MGSRERVHTSAESAEVLSSLRDLVREQLYGRNEYTNVSFNVSIQKSGRPKMIEGQNFNPKNANFIIRNLPLCT